MSFIRKCYTKYTLPSKRKHYEESTRGTATNSTIGHLSDKKVFLLIVIAIIVCYILLGIRICTNNNQGAREETFLGSDSIESVDEMHVDDEISSIDHLLNTGDTPYSDYYGYNLKCGNEDCTGIKVTAPESSDVVVIVKRNNEQGSVAGHAYIQAGDTYKINLLDGTYQTFFYCGEEWSPYKEMGNGVKGGFVRDEAFSKDSPQEICNAVLTYVLQLRKDGNFHAESSNRSEIF